MGDSPQVSETFARQWYPEDESVEAHHRALVAQARQHERATLLSRETHKRINALADAFTRVEAGQLKLGAEQGEIKRILADKGHSTALKQALISGGCSVLVALTTLAGVYAMRDKPEPESKPLAPETLEAIKLYRERTGYALGQRPPSGAEPEPFDAGSK